MDGDRRRRRWRRMYSPGCGGTAEATGRTTAPCSLAVSGGGGGGGGGQTDDRGQLHVKMAKHDSANGHTVLTHVLKLEARHNLVRYHLALVRTTVAQLAIVHQSSVAIMSQGPGCVLPFLDHVCAGLLYAIVVLVR
ncbi:hypothetical protein [Oryza sativa Japonica Group]|uniref:Uncharacterized protein n=1 Tax=Oryza sativa subsp. japonica TaxID=39947 RepID=Q5JMN0_ORYSJ|nr:hypothetical protein [Oryza sativa Japonica Group]